MRRGGRDASDIVDKIIRSGSTDPLLMDALRQIVYLRDELATAIRERGEMATRLDAITADTDHHRTSRHDGDYNLVAD